LQHITGFILWRLQRILAVLQTVAMLEMAILRHCQRFCNTLRDSGSSALGNDVK
jgi:hypothetical protein